MGADELRKVLAGIAVTSLVAGTALGGCAAKNGAGGGEAGSAGQKKEQTESQPGKSG